ncbi:MAG: hypothetical protein ACRDRK_06330 [Pseudonocardia sp.]
MARPEQRGLPRSQDHPVLVFEGGRGSGKSALLTGLATLLDQRVPYALIDFEKSRHAAVPEVLAALAFELSKRCGRYGGLRFPRFAVGQVVMRQDLDRDDRSRAHQQVRTALEKECNLDRVRQILEEAAAGVVASGTVPVPLPPSLARLVPGLVLGWLTRWVPSRRIVLGPFHDWYGHQGRGRTNDALDTLVDLNRWAKHSADEDNRQRIDQLLWDAFVADLRDHFAGGRHAGELSLNCVILLDNADMPLGQRFVNGLAQARRQRVAMGDDTGDPLTAVVTSRGRLLADVPAEGVELAMTNGEVRRRAGHEGGARRWWCRYGLADLTQDEIGIMVSALSLRDGNNQRLTLMVHQLTGGHPASSRLLLDAVAARPDNRDDLTTVLDQPEPVAQSARMTVAERMQRYLLGELPDEVLDDLVTCAGARERQHAVRLATSSTLLDCGQATYTAVIDPVLWPVIAGTGPVLLRRLLLRTLRRRHDGGLPDWSEVFAWHRGQCAARGDETGELYYALANGDLAFVTQRLYEHLGSDEVTSWLELLASVITAPRRPQERDAPVVPMEQMRALIREIDLPSPLVPLASLVTCRWIADDPFSGSRLHGLHRQITADYTALARQFPDGAEQLLFAAGDYQRRAESWT